jgi:hypothetical protein
MSESQRRRCRDALGTVEQVVVVVPVDPDEDEAEDVHRECRKPVVERGQIDPGRSAQVERHERDHHGDDAVAERVEPLRADLGDGAPLARRCAGVLVGHVTILVDTATEPSDLGASDTPSCTRLREIHHQEGFRAYRLSFESVWTR